MQYITFMLNLPWTVLGIFLSIISIPYKVSSNKKSLAIIFYVKSFWWYSWIPGKKKVRAMTNGHIIQLGPLEQNGDVAHELIHVEQAIREPFIHPFLYQLETIKRGYRNNKYEDEAYSRAGNTHTGK